MYTTSAVGPEMSMKVIRAAFPLGKMEQDVLDGLAGFAAVEKGYGTTTTTSSGGVATPTGTRSSSLASSDTNGGTIAGIVVGCLALLGFIAVGVYLCLGYRKEGKEEELKRKVEAERGEQRLIDHAAVGRGMDGEKSEEHVAELQVGAAVAVIELPVPCSRPPGQFNEMGDTGVVELPTDYNEGGRRLSTAIGTNSLTAPGSIGGQRQLTGTRAEH